MSHSRDREPRLEPRREVDRNSPTVPIRPRDVKSDARPVGDATDPGSMPAAPKSINRITPHLNLSSTMSVSPSLFRRGQRVGDYEIVEEIGRGGMGVIFKAKQAGLNRTVALKMVLRGDFAHFDELVRFRSEAQAIGRLHHPNLVNIFEIGDHDGLPFYAMEFLDGGTLSQRLTGKRMVSLAAARLILPLVQAIEYAHSQGIIHRDLKPSNILFALANVSVDKNVAKIADFGVAKHLGDNSGLTRTGDILGTPAYMAPEQATGKSGEVGPASDVYSLGAILYETLTGRAPFVGVDPADTLLQMLNNEPTPVRKLNPKVPVDLETICLKCLEKDPSRRYQSAGLLAEDLRRFLADEPILARPAPIHQRVRKWVRRRPVHATMLAAGVLLTILGVGSLVALWQQALAKAMVEAEMAQIERASADKTQTLLADALLERGIALAEKNDVRRGLHWMVRSLETAEKVSDRDPQAAALAEAVRYNLAHWGSLAAPPEKTLHHDHWAWAVDFTPDGDTAITGGRDNRLCAWDVATGKILGQPNAFGVWVWAVAAHPAGYVIGGGGNALDRKAFGPAFNKGEIRVYRQLPNNAGLEQVGKTFAVRSVKKLALSPDGQWLLAMNHDTGATLYAFNPAADQPLKFHAQVAQAGLLFAEFSQDSKRIFFASQGEVHRYHIDQMSFVQPAWTVDHPITAMNISADRKILAVSSFDSANSASWIDLWKVDHNQSDRKRVFHLHGATKTMAFSPDSRHLVISTMIQGIGTKEFQGQVHAVEVHYVHRDEEVRDKTHGLYGPQGHTRPVWAIQFHPSGKYYATGGEDGSSRLWDLATGQPISLAMKHEGTVANLAISSRGTHLITASAGGSPDANARLLELPAFATLPRIHHQTALHCIAWESDGRHFIAQDQALRFRRWDSKTDTLVAEFDKSMPVGAYFSEIGLVREFDVARKRVNIYDAGTLEKINEVPDFDVDQMPHFTLPKHIPFYNRATGKMCMYRIADNAPIASADFPGPPSSSFGHSQSGRHASILNPPAAGDDKPSEVRVWDLDMNVLAAWKLPNRSNMGLFNGAGDIVALRGDYQFRFFDLRSGKQVYKSISHEGRARCCVFHPKENLLLFAGGDGQIGLWHIASSKSIGKQPDLSAHPMFISPRPDGSAYYAGARDLHIIEWPHLEPKTQPTAWLKRWVENLTGMIFDVNDELTPIDAVTLVARRQAKD